MFGRTKLHEQILGTQETLEKQPDLKVEFARRKSHTAALLELLKNNDRVTTAQLERAGGFKYSSRMSELRKEGHIIKATYDRPGQWLYTYFGQKEEQ